MDGGLHCLMNSGTCFLRASGKEQVLSSVRGGSMGTGHDWLAGPIFYSKVS